MSKPTKEEKEKALTKKALEYIKQGNLKDAENIYRGLISSGTKNHVVYSNLAVICGQKGYQKEKIELLKKALILNPNFSEAHNNLGNALSEIGDLNSAINCFQKAIKLNSKFAEAYNNLGLTLKKHGNYNDAITSLEKAIDLKPNYPEAYHNLGLAQYEIEDLKSSMYSYQTAIKLKPNYIDAMNNLGNIFQQLGDINYAIKCFKKAIFIEPNYPDLYWNLSRAQLLKNNYIDGLKNYEFRSQCKVPTLTHCKPDIQKWNGEPLKKGDKLHVISEQGLGDTMQFMRYILYLKYKGFNISFCCQKQLHNLIKVSGIHPSPLSDKQVNLITEGKWISLLSLPLHLSVTPINPIINKQYIYSSTELINKWKNILAVEERPIIGINWQGNPHTEKNILKGRSLILESFSTITKTNNVKLLSLQKGFGSEQLKNCSFLNKFVNCQDKVNEIWDFVEVAAIIINCDLVITSDTSIAHLAGGMGKRTWLLLKDIPDWRWGLKDDKTFWYPSIRLFRQKERNNWSEVIERVSLELKSYDLK